MRTSLTNRIAAPESSNHSGFYNVYKEVFLIKQRTHTLLQRPFSKGTAKNVRQNDLIGSSDVHLEPGPLDNSFCLRQTKFYYHVKIASQNSIQALS